MSLEQKSHPKFIVCSGGQTGVDQGALLAACQLDIPTGGYAPAGYRTLYGPDPELLRDRYKLQELPSCSYADRTMANVKTTNGTLRIAKTWSSPGERCTIKWIRHFGKPYLDIDFNSDPRDNIPKAVNWINELRKIQEVGIIPSFNIAGNSESTCPGIESWSCEFLREVFQEVLNSDNP